MKRFKITLLLLLLLFCMVENTAFALQMRVVQVQQDATRFRVFVSLDEMPRKLDPTVFSVSIDSQRPLTPKAVVSKGSKMPGLHYLILTCLDVSATDDAQQATRHAVENLIEGMNDNDSASIYKMEDRPIAIMEHENDRERLFECLDEELSTYGNSPNLLAGVNQMIEIGGSTSYMDVNGYTQRTAIVVLAYGTQGNSEYESAVESASSFPVYAITSGISSADEGWLDALCRTRGGILARCSNVFSMDSAIEQVQDLINQTIQLTCQTTDSGYFGVPRAQWTVSMAEKDATYYASFVTSTQPVEISAEQRPIAFSDATIAQLAQQTLGYEPTVAEKDSLTQIKTLSVEDTPLDSLDDLNRLTGLESLSLHDCSLVDVSSIEWAHMDNLTYLDLSGNKALSDIECLAALPALQELNLSSTAVEYIEPLKELRSLTTLDLSYTLARNSNMLAEMDQLKSLDVSHSRINQMEPLMQMIMNGCAVKAEGLPNNEDANNDVAPLWLVIPLVVMIVGFSTVLTLIILQERKVKKRQKATSPKDFDLPATTTRLTVKIIDGAKERLLTLPLPDRVPILIGRERETFDHQLVCAIQLKNDKTVSSRHCQLELRFQHVYVKDLGSKNGIYVNGEKVVAETAVQEDDILSVGASKVIIQRILL